MAPQAPAPNVREMFARVSQRYDRLNRVLSFGLDRAWRRQLAQQVAEQRPRRLVDLATGSGDVLLALQRAKACVEPPRGLDFSADMLERAKSKGLPDEQLMLGDATALRLPDASLDAITIAFGLRNLPDRTAALKEWKRGLAPGGWLYILEFSQPWRFLRPMHFFYLRRVLPHIARALGAPHEDYEYLGRSIRAFPNAAALTEELVCAGYEAVSVKRLTFGVVAIHRARRPTA